MSENHDRLTALWPGLRDIKREEQRFVVLELLVSFILFLYSLLFHLGSLLPCKTSWRLLYSGVHPIAHAKPVVWAPLASLCPPHLQRTKRPRTEERAVAASLTCNVSPLSQFSARFRFRRFETIDDPHILACPCTFPICPQLPRARWTGVWQQIDNREIHGPHLCIQGRRRRFASYVDIVHRASYIVHRRLRHGTRPGLALPAVASCWRMGS